MCSFPQICQAYADGTMPSLEVPIATPEAVADCIGKCLQVESAKRATFKALLADLMLYCRSSDDSAIEAGDATDAAATDMADGSLVAADIEWGDGIGEIVQSGWLTKQGGGRSALGRASWKRRWFVLRDNGSLAYSRTTRPDTKPLGIIPLQQASAVAPESPLEPTFVDAACFAITTSDRVYHLVANTKEERMIWMQLIGSAIDGFARKHPKSWP